MKDKSTCFQLDPFHRNKAVKEKIHEQAARDAVLELIKTEEIEEVFRYLEIYRNSLSDESEIEDVEDLIVIMRTIEKDSCLISLKISIFQIHRKGWHIGIWEQWKTVYGA